MLLERTRSHKEIDCDSLGCLQSLQSKSWMDFHNGTRCEVNTLAKCRMGLAVSVHWPSLKIWLQREMHKRVLVYRLPPSCRCACVNWAHNLAPSVSEWSAPTLTSAQEMIRCKRSTGSFTRLHRPLSASFLDWSNESCFDIADSQPQHGSYQFSEYAHSETSEGRNMETQTLHEWSTWLISYSQFLKQSRERSNRHSKWHVNEKEEDDKLSASLTLPNSADRNRTL